MSYYVDMRIKMFVVADSMVEAMEETAKQLPKDCLVRWINIVEEVEE